MENWKELRNSGPWVWEAWDPGSKGWRLCRRPWMEQGLFPRCCPAHALPVPRPEPHVLPALTLWVPTVLAGGCRGTFKGRLGVQLMKQACVRLRPLSWALMTSWCPVPPPGPKGETGRCHAPLSNPTLVCGFEPCFLKGLCLCKYSIVIQGG